MPMRHRPWWMATDEVQDALMRSRRADEWLELNRLRAQAWVALAFGSLLGFVLGFIVFCK